MNIQTLHPAPAQIDSERLRPTAETPETAVNAVTGAGEAPGITAAAKTSGSGSEEGGIRGELRDRYAPEKPTKGAGLYSMGKDEDGNPVLRFDSPDKAKEAAGEKTPAEEKEAAKEEQAARQAEEERETERPRPAPSPTPTVWTGSCRNSGRRRKNWPRSCAPPPARKRKASSRS